MQPIWYYEYMHAYIALHVCVGAYSIKRRPKTQKRRPPFFLLVHQCKVTKRWQTTLDTY